MLDKNPRRCRGVCRYAIRCKREGEPTGPHSEYWCHDHLKQEPNLGTVFRDLDKEDERDYFGVSE